MSYYDTENELIFEAYSENRKPSDPIIPDALNWISKNANAVEFTDKNEFTTFLKQQNYFSLRDSHCYYSKHDLELARRGDPKFRDGTTGVSEANRGCILQKDSGDLVSVWDEQNSIGFIIPSNKL